MTLIVDASVALKWVVDEPGSEAAEQLRKDALAAPDLWLIETANALWTRARRNLLSAADVTALFSILCRATVRTTPSHLDVIDALRLAAELNHPVYDCLYLAAALREDGVVVTADTRFLAAVQGTLLSERVRRLGD